MKLKKVGKVFLVGAGPGDPGLITTRGASLINRADMVVVDALVNPVLFQHKDLSQIIYVGKRGPGAPCGASLRLPQDGINALLIKLAKKGLSIVRLKGGDPFVFGRGGEEMEALIKNKIPFEIVPGVSSAIAVPAYAGIPISDRRLASQVTFLTGHESDFVDPRNSRIDWGTLPKNGTLVVLMGVSKWPLISERLLSAGWLPQTPVAAIESGTTANQRVCLTELKRSQKDFRAFKLVAPAVIVIGNVVGKAQSLPWVTKEKPLFGKKIVVTRAEDQNKKILELLEEKGAFVISCPAIKIVPLEDKEALQSLLAQQRDSKSKFDKLIFLSANGVRSFTQYIGSNKVLFEKIPIFVVGPHTKEVAEQEGWKVRKMAFDFQSSGILSVLGNIKGENILVPRAQGAPREFFNQLKKRGAFVKEVNTYQTVSANPPSKSLKNILLSGVDGITFTSASTVNSFFKFFNKKEFQTLCHSSVMFSIGPMTTSALKIWKVKKIVESKISSTEGVVQTIEKKFHS